MHAAVVLEATAAGGVILSSHICYHRAEDACTCRKPATGLLAEAFAQHPGYDLACGRGWSAIAPRTCWPGAAFGLQTALVGDVARGGPRAARRRGADAHLRGPRSARPGRAPRA